MNNVDKYFGDAVSRPIVRVKSGKEVFGSRQLLAKLPDFKISLLGKDLALTSLAKDLGVVLDPQLTFDDHVLKTTSSCMSSLAQISRVKHVLDRNQLVTVINALVFSKLLYCSTVWSNTSNKNISRLQSVQNFAARIITGIRKFGCLPVSG